MSYLITKENIRWHYNVLGKGNCIFFIHGWAANMRVFSQQARYFSQEYKVVLVDLPGHGKTNWKEITFDDIATGIKDIADVIGINKFSIVGSSMGGFVGLKIAQLFPQRVEKLAMIGSLPKFLKTQKRPLGLTEFEMNKLKQQIQTKYPGILDIFFRSLFTLQERESEKFKWIHQFRKQEKVPQREALESFLEMLKEGDLTEFAESVNIPILFLAGRKDYICSQSSLKFIGNIVPKATIEFMEDCGHFPFLIKSEEFNKKVEKFLIS
ncbi:MAG: alpha/beta hydrolase [Candidatus Omnitrophica bacterium]|nr:alpha/beta hydrolase [Candidatus Omnitrophota bacterium]